MGCILVGRGQLSYAAEADPTVIDRSLVVLNTKNFDLMVTDKGGLRYAIQAEEMRQYQSGNLELVGKVQAVELADDGVQKLVVQADSVFYNKTLKFCMMRGHVFVQQVEGCLSISTEQLSYDMDREILSTHLPVKIQQQDSFVTGVGFFATKDFQEYSIGEPNGAFDVLLPND